MITDAAVRLWVGFGAHAATKAPHAPKSDEVTPGVIGFFVMFLIAVVTVLLIIDMTRRIRRVRYRDEVSRKLDEEERAERERATDQPG